LAPLVLQAADEGDGAARQLIERAIEYWTELVQAVRQRWSDATAPLAWTLILGGGLLVTRRDLAQRLLHRLSQIGMVPAHVVFADDPVRGPLRVAATLADPRQRVAF
jgi:N-acetylglucosamine kinase-like BadF-type ATPase